MTEINKEDSSEKFSSKKIAVLLYVNDEERNVEVISPTWIDLISLISARNKLATYLKSSASFESLPNMLRNASECEHCFQAAECMVYHASLEQGSDVTSGAPELFQYLTRSLSASHLSYLRHWEHLIDLEASATKCNLNLTVASSVREAEQQKCIGGLMFHSSNNWIKLEESVSPYCCESNISLVLAKYHHGSLATASTSSEDLLNQDKPMPNLSAGDKVNISLEILYNESGDSVLMDIEDVGNGEKLQLLRNKIGLWSIDSTEPNIVSGQVTQVNIDTIIVAVGVLPIRLLRYS